MTPFTAWPGAAKATLAGSLLGALLMLPATALASTTATFGCTGAPQTATVPANASQATVTLSGAKGGRSAYQTYNASHFGSQAATGGQGDIVTISLPVVPGQSFGVNVGCSNGYGGGGGGGTDAYYGSVVPPGGGVGGGATDITVAGGDFAQAYAVAGGGGGVGDVGANAFSTGAGGSGGNGTNTGGANGENAGDGAGGQGGQGADNGAAGGAGGSGATFTGGSGGNGAAGVNGNAPGGGTGGNGNYWGGGGGGGGGGWVSGGGGGAGGIGSNSSANGAGGAGGGGGSSNVASGVTELSENAGNNGDGSVIIAYNTPTLSVTPTSNSYGGVVVDQTSSQLFTVSNSGGSTLSIGAASLTGTNPGQFAITQDNCANQNLSGSETCSVRVAFVPAVTGSDSASLSIPSNSDAGSPTTVPLSGTGQNPPAPVNTTAPSISGTAQQGQTLTADHGTWTANPTGYGYQWQDCNSQGNNCTNITGATSSSYTPTSGDVGNTIAVEVSATNAGGTGGPVSSQTTATALVPAPVNTAAPSISGTAQQGQTLTADHGTWTGSPTGYGYQWRDCDSQGNNCTNITGATSQTYTPASSDVGDTIRVAVTTTGAGGSVTRASATTGTVAAAPIPTAPTSANPTAPTSANPTNTTPVAPVKLRITGISVTGAPIVWCQDDGCGYPHTSLGFVLNRATAVRLVLRTRVHGHYKQVEIATLNGHQGINQHRIPGRWHGHLFPTGPVQILVQIQPGRHWETAKTIGLTVRHTR